jgi:subtilisin family serine protease
MPKICLRLRAAFMLALTSTATLARADAVVEPSVRAQLQASPDHTSTVIILLRRPPHLVNEATHRESIRQVQDRVLDRLTMSDYTPGHKFENVPALVGRITDAGLAKLAANPEVLAIGVDAEVRPHLASSAPFIKSDVVNALGYRGQGVTVAVVDSGIDTNHPDLSDDIAPGAWHFLSAGANQGPGAEDDMGHGTSVAGIITSRGVVAPPGVAPDADILAIKVLNPVGASFLSDVARAVDYVVSVRGNYANLASINISIGSFALYTQCPCDSFSANNQLMGAAIQSARDVGILTFVASLNDGQCNSMTSPACLSAAVAVANVFDTVASLGCGGDPPAPDWIVCTSNRSACNSLSAPGAEITTSALGGGATSGTGTSFSSPHCAAVAALVRQKDALDCTTLTATDLLNIIKSTGHPTIDPCDLPPDPISAPTSDSPVSPSPTHPNPIRIDALAALNAVLLRGDFNLDHAITDVDVPGFIAVLLGEDLDPAHVTLSDMNCDNLADGHDIDGFVRAALN